MKTNRKASVEYIGGDGDGYVYSNDGNSRLGFSPLSTIKREPPTDNEPITYWQTNWGAPDEADMPHMISALKEAFPNREIVAS